MTTLQYDDEPGSWGRASLNWPRLLFQSQADVDRAYVACSREGVVPYGAYVLDGLELRIASEELKNKLAVHLVQSPFKTHREVIAHLNFV